MFNISRIIQFWEERKGSCPKCGASITMQDASCPSCDYEFDENDKNEILLNADVCFKQSALIGALVFISFFIFVIMIGVTHS